MTESTVGLPAERQNDIEQQAETLLSTAHVPYGYIYRVEKNCLAEKMLKKYIPTKYITKGTFGSIYLVCENRERAKRDSLRGSADGTAGCKYVVKIMKADFSMQKRHILKEINMATQMGEPYKNQDMRELPAVGPKIIDSFSCSGEYFDVEYGSKWEETTLYFIIMEKMDMTLDGYIRNYSKQYMKNREFILKKMKGLLLNMYSRGYIHRDLHNKNVMLNVGDDGEEITDIKIIDFDSVFETELTAEDFVKFAKGELKTLVPIYFGE